MTAFKKALSLIVASVLLSSVGVAQADAEKEHQSYAKGLEAGQRDRHAGKAGAEKNEPMKAGREREGYRDGFNRDNSNEPAGKKPDNP